MKDKKVKMFREITTAIIGISLAVVFIPASVSAAPAWRGEARTTFQQWTFSTPYTEPAEPDSGWVNDYGTPTLDYGNSQWGMSSGLHSGICVLSGFMDISIPNYEVIQPEKEMWVELMWRASEYDFSRLPSYPILGVETDIGYDRMEIEKTNTSLNDEWIITLYKIHIWPNPTSEWVTIRGDIYIDSVTIDTICIPEPATIALVGIGTAMFLRRRKHA